MGLSVDRAQPDFITVEQAAEIIGIGRTCAYQLARRAADFGEGTFPAVRFGRQLRVPRRKLEDLVGGPEVFLSLPRSSVGIFPNS